MQDAMKPQQRSEADSTIAPPVISLESPLVVEEIRRACASWGAFVLTDHGLDEGLLDEIVKTGHTFFDLPMEIKRKYDLQKHGTKCRGYMPFGGEKTMKAKIQDFQEGLYMGDEHKADDPQFGQPSFGSNVYPDEEIPHMKQLFNEYHKKMKALGNRMMNILSLGLSLPEDCIQDAVTNHNPVILPRMFRYPPQYKSQSRDETRVQERHSGIGEHSDSGLWTMILTDTPGLEFCHPKYQTWHAVPFFRNTIIMNVGDILDRLSAGRFVSPYHRAFNDSTTMSRLSLPFYFNPSWEARIETLPVPKLVATVPYDECDISDIPRNKITCLLDHKPGVQYSELLTQQVAKLFPSLITDGATNEPSTHDTVYTHRVLEHLKSFYQIHQDLIKESHGLGHAITVYEHSCQAIACHQPPVSSTTAMEIKTAALLHDTDDGKYFPDAPKGLYPNARQILDHAEIPMESQENIIQMISLVSCSENGNYVPDFIRDTNSWYKLIPRWSDRLEAVGSAGVVRCFQYSKEIARPLSSPRSPRAQTAQEVWDLCPGERFQSYQCNGPTDDDMITHYYDKLLHVSRPTPEIVKNQYLIEKAKSSSKELVEICVRYGKTGKVDVDYIEQLADKLGAAV